MPNLLGRVAILVTILGLVVLGFAGASQSRSPLFDISNSDHHFPAVVKSITRPAWNVPLQKGSAQLTPDRLHQARYLVMGSLAPASRTVELQLSPIRQTDRQSFNSPPLAPLQAASQRRSSASPRQSLKVSSEHGLASPPAVQERFFRFPSASQTSTAHLALIPIKAKLVCRGEKAQVFLDDRDASLDLRQHGNRIVSLLDEEIIPRMERRLGAILDLDGDQRLSLLLTSHLREMVPQENVGAVPLKGLTWSEDFHPDSTVGNHADLIYLGVDLPDDKGLRSLLQHELTHAVFFSHQQHAGDLHAQEDWLSEGIAHLAETWDNQDSSNWGSRLHTFNAATGDYPLVVPSYAQAGLWRNPGCRGATFQFLYWCEQCCGHSFGQRLLHAPGTARQRLETATGIPFPELFRQWSCASILTPERLPADLAQVTEKIPQVVDYDPRRPQRITLRGTSFRILKLPPDAGIRIQAPEGSTLQITLLP